MESKIQAKQYNTIRLGMLRIDNPLVVTPSEVQNIKCYLFNDKWICVDMSSNEFPLAVWRDFNNFGRAIHDPVTCKVHIFHVMAGRIVGTVLYSLENIINKRLAQDKLLISHI